MRKIFAVTAAIGLALGVSACDSLTGDDADETATAEDGTAAATGDGAAATSEDAAGTGTADAAASGGDTGKGGGDAGAAPAAAAAGGAATGKSGGGAAGGAGAGAVNFGDDSSRWSNDDECDDPRFAGRGMTNTPLLDEDIGHDATDCRTAFERGDLTLR